MITYLTKLKLFQQEKLKAKKLINTSQSRSFIKLIVLQFNWFISFFQFGFNTTYCRQRNVSRKTCLRQRKWTTASARGKTKMESERISLRFERGRGLILEKHCENSPLVLVHWLYLRLCLIICFICINQLKQWWTKSLFCTVLFRASFIYCSTHVLFVSFVSIP